MLLKGNRNRKGIDMKITLITPLPSYFPTTMRFRREAQFLAEMGHDVVLIMPGKDKHFQNDPDTKYTILFSFLLSIPFPCKKESGINEIKIIKRLFTTDIVHTVKPLHNCFYFIIAKYIGRKKTVFEIEDYESKGPMRFLGRLSRLLVYCLERICPRSADLVVSVNDTITQRIIRDGINKNKLIQLPVSIDTSSLNGGDANIAKAMLGLDITKKPFVYMGSLEREWDLDILLKAIQILKCDNHNIILLVTGKGGDRFYFEQMVKNLQIEDYVRFLGFLPIESLRHIISLAYAFVLPMRNNEINKNRFPIKLLDYLSIGKPVIASKVGVIGEIMNDGINGILAEPGSYEDLAEKLRAVLDDEPKAKWMGLNGLKVSKKFDTNIVMGKLIKKYYSLLKN